MSLNPIIDQCVGRFFSVLCPGFSVFMLFGKNALCRARNAYCENVFVKTTSTSIGRQLVHLLVDPLEAIYNIDLAPLKPIANDRMGPDEGGHSCVLF